MCYKISTSKQTQVKPNSKSIKKAQKQSGDTTELGNTHANVALETQKSSSANNFDKRNLERNDSCSEKGQATQRPTLNTEAENIIKIVCISDTHNGHEQEHFAEKIKNMTGDILIHAGDFGDTGTAKEIESAFKWLCSLDNFKYKVFISGNMDGIGLDRPQLGAAEAKRKKFFQNDKNVFYLENDWCEILGLKIYGCPYTPKFCGGFQYMLKSPEAKHLWSFVPDDCHILVSHGPPAGILDLSSRGAHIGCPDLRDAIYRRNLLKTIIFGHVHYSYGTIKNEDKWFINAAQFNGIYDNDRRIKPVQLFIRRDEKSVHHIE